MGELLLSNDPLVVLLQRTLAWEGRREIMHMLNTEYCNSRTNSLWNEKKKFSRQRIDYMINNILMQKWDCYLTGWRTDWSGTTICNCYPHHDATVLCLSYISMHIYTVIVKKARDKLQSDAQEKVLSLTVASVTVSSTQLGNRFH